jgi:hypothetical protein
MGADGVRFYTELKSVTAHWFSEEEAREGKVQNSWDGMISFPDKKQGRKPTLGSPLFGLRAPESLPFLRPSASPGA